MKLSVLDQSPLRAGATQDAAIRETLELARHCETLGYYRYWLSEHHNDDAIVGTAPEILIGVIAATTSRIRVGSAGIMLPNYSALKVAEQFRVLEAIAPGRIDLGVGRVAGGDGRTAHALNPNAAKAGFNFPAQVKDLQAWTRGQDLPMGHPFRGIKANPQGPYAPQIWILGSSLYGAQMAAHFGLPYCFAHFLNGGKGTAEAFDIYREKYVPSELNPKPHAAITVAALAGETRQEAEENFLFRTGASEPTEEERAHAEQIKQRAFIGEAADVANRIRTLATELQLDEIAITSYANDPAIRRKSYSLLAREFGLDETRAAETAIKGFGREIGELIPH